MKLLVFVSSHCPHCPPAERRVKQVAPQYSEYGLTHYKIRTKTSEGKKLSAKYNIRGTPTIVFVSDSEKELDRIVGAPSEITLHNRIKKLLGLKKSFFSKIFQSKTEK